MKFQTNKEKELWGVMLGTALGDSIGLPFEGIGRKRILKLFKNQNRHHFIFGRGMISDDTEHTIMVYQSLVEGFQDSSIFEKSLSRRMKLWLLSLPAGTGIATAKAIVKLIIGFNPNKSGVDSAGNGPAMRCAILGVLYGHDKEKLREYIKRSTRITHTDIKAEFGALAVAHAAYLFSNSNKINPSIFYNSLQHLLEVEDNNEFLLLIKKVTDSVGRNEETWVFAENLGLNNGVTGYMYHTIPVVLHAWLSYKGDFKDSIVKMIQCGGDVDTTAAILGSILGAGLEEKDMPHSWRKGLFEFPRSYHYMKKLSQQLSTSINEDKPQKALRLSGIMIVLRNVLFLMIVLFHGFRRLLPPY
ncbi:MAG: dinitrogenase reductase [Planctomycetota bacterium]|nr:MAG: dinitrogenase reductase [Planctomycetota bacterium]